MAANSSYMRLAGRGDLDREKQERRTKGRMPMEGLRCNYGQVLDLSPGGACIQCGGLFGWPIGKRVVLVFQTESEKLAVQAVVVRVIKDSMYQRRYGMKFVNLSPKQSSTVMQFAKDCRPQLMVASPSTY